MYYARFPRKFLHPWQNEAAACLILSVCDERYRMPERYDVCYGRFLSQNETPEFISDYDGGRADSRNKYDFMLESGGARASWMRRTRARPAGDSLMQKRLKTELASGKGSCDLEYSLRDTGKV